MFYNYFKCFISPLSQSNYLLFIRIFFVLSRLPTFTFLKSGLWKISFTNRIPWLQRKIKLTISLLSPNGNLIPSARKTGDFALDNFFNFCRRAFTRAQGIIMNHLVTEPSGIRTYCSRSQSEISRNILNGIHILSRNCK